MSNKKITLDLEEYNELLDEKERLKSVNSELVKGATVVYRPEIGVRQPSLRFKGEPKYCLSCDIVQEDYKDTLNRLKDELFKIVNMKDINIEVFKKDKIEFEKEKGIFEANKRYELKEFEKWKSEQEEEIESKKNEDSYKFNGLSFLLGVILTSVIIMCFGG